MEKGLCYIGRPDSKYVGESGTETTVPKREALGVYVSEDSVAYHSRWFVVDEKGIPERWMNDFEERAL